MSTRADPGRPDRPADPDRPRLITDALGSGTFGRHHARGRHIDSPRPGGASVGVALRLTNRARHGGTRGGPRLDLPEIAALNRLGLASACDSRRHATRVAAYRAFRRLRRGNCVLRDTQRAEFAPPCSVALLAGCDSDGLRPGPLRRCRLHDQHPTRSCRRDRYLGGGAGCATASRKSVLAGRPRLVAIAVSPPWQMAATARAKSSHLGHPIRLRGPKRRSR